MWVKFQPLIFASLPLCYLGVVFCPMAPLDFLVLRGTNTEFHFGESNLKKVRLAQNTNSFSFGKGSTHLFPKQSKGFLW